MFAADDTPKTGLERLRTRRTSDLSRVLNPKENQGEEGQGEEGKRTPGGRRRRGPPSADGSLPVLPSLTPSSAHLLECVLSGGGSKRYAGPVLMTTGQSCASCAPSRPGLP